MKMKLPYYNRELSWMDFNARVLEECYEPENPVLERCRFLGISGSNLDEFFMVRVAGVLEQIENHITKQDPSGLTPVALYSQLSEKIHAFSKRQYSCLSRSILPALKKEGIHFLRIEDMNEEQMESITDYFHKVLFPVLTPLAIDTSRPFPFLANKTLNICVRLHDETAKGSAKNAFAVVQVPGILPRFLDLSEVTEDSAIPSRSFVLLEDVIIHGLDTLFEGHKILSCTMFRITRDSDLDIDEDASDLLIEVQKSIKKRKRGKPVRLEIGAKADKKTRDFLIHSLEIAPDEVYEQNGPLDLTLFSKFAGIQAPEDLTFKKLIPVNPPADFYGYTDMFAAIREKDRMVHHPYESFDPVVNFIRQAADDRSVLAIKQTLYRVSGHSPIIAALIRAAENGKQVTVLVELKARFDEENNINWAMLLEHAGCHVIYGLVGLKTHCKITLVVRKESDGIRRYVHMGTGNYNDSTAKLYTDIGLFTCREPFGVDASSLFNVLTGYSQPPIYNEMLVAPHGLRSAFEYMIDREAANAARGLPAGITVKVNSLVDEKIINKLYTASQSGVKIRLIVRGICCLIPGIPGVSENITVTSIVGQLLEHSRIFLFENGGNPKIYMGSADWMPRNLDRRVELVFPILDEDARKRARCILDTILSDNVNARVMQSDTTFVRVPAGKPRVNCQTTFIRQARQMQKNKIEEEHGKQAHPKA